ncbi:MAG: hypothetical protein LC776_03920, partial [Acidobacteria bacterium]|nr:hypothetical protein [Acidobacteriota bacterium]
SSSPSAHEVACTEEVHLPQPEDDLRQSHSDLSGAPRPAYPEVTLGVSSTPVKDPVEGVAGWGRPAASLR